uniref:Uncharacterized protein n=1 Tax=Anopheles farauti TaxID=69004 RepID=A0A182QYK5_9DIPT
MAERTYGLTSMMRAPSAFERTPASGVSGAGSYGFCGETPMRGCGALRLPPLPVVASSPEIDLAILPDVLVLVATSDATGGNSGRDDGGPGIGGAEGGGCGDELPPLSVACGGGDINASCGEVMLFALSDFTIPPVELERCTEAVMPDAVAGGPLFSCREFCARSFACFCSCFWLVWEKNRKA